MYIKQFDSWNQVKKQVNDTTHKMFVRAGEVRWAIVGTNIGSEIDGKGSSFTRPVLIMHVIGSHLALVIPLSTSVKTIPGYVPFVLKGKTVSLCVHQIRIVSQKRLLARTSRISEARLKEVKKMVSDFFAM